MYFFSLFVACSLVKMLSEFACLDITISQSNSDDCRIKDGLCSHYSGSPALLFWTNVHNCYQQMEAASCSFTYRSKHKLKKCKNGGEMSVRSASFHSVPLRK